MQMDIQLGLCLSLILNIAGKYNAVHLIRYEIPLCRSKTAGPSETVS